MICSCSIIGNNVKIGDRSKVWHFVNIMDGVQIGDDCMIGSYVQIDPGSRIGNRVRIQPYSAITGGVEDDVFIGPHVTMVDALHPPGYTKNDKQPWIGKGAMIGAGSIIMANVGPRAAVAAGTIVSKPVEAEEFIISKHFIRDKRTRAQYELKRG